MSGGNYVRVYTSVLTDEKFRGMSLESRGAWLWLLIYADEMYPEPAPLPRWLKRKTLTDLVDRGLVDPCEDDHFRMHGLEKERQRRSASAAIGGNARAAKAKQTLSERTPNDMPSQAEQSKAEPSRADAPEADAFETYQRLTMRIAKGGAAQWIGRLIDKYDEALVERAIVHAHRQDADPSTLLGRVEGLLDQRAFREEKQAEQARKDRAFREMEEQRQKAMSLTPEQEARVEENKRRVAEMLAAAGKEMA